MNETSSAPGKGIQPISGYEIIERIGSGGMGTVYKANQISMNRVVALKILKKSDLVDPIPLDRLRREAMIIARMDHPNIVKGIDMGETDRYYFFTMEFIKGRSIKSALDLYGPMEEVRAAGIVREIANALQYAYEQKLTHRDIKPGNVIISTEGKVKLADLGLAKRESDLTVTREGSTVGTPQYISPEQARNPKTADTRSDIYSLGATFYHMVTGRMPFEGESIAEVLTKVLFGKPPLPEAVRPGLSHGTSRVISRMMAKDPCRRYQTPVELLDDLDVLIESLRDGAGQLGNLVGMAWKESQRGPWLRKSHIITGAAVLLIIAVLCFFIVSGGGWNGEPRKDARDAAVLKISIDYDSGRITPAQALVGIASLPAGHDAVKAEETRRNVLDGCRQILIDLFMQSSPRYGKALVQGGFNGCMSLLKRDVSTDAISRLGKHPSRLSPELGSFWREKIAEAESFMKQRIREARATLIDVAEEEIAARVREANRLTGEGAYESAWNRVDAFLSGTDEILRVSSERLSERLRLSGPVSGSYKDAEAREKVELLVRESADSARENLVNKIGAAHTAYFEELRSIAENLLNSADADLLGKGISAVLERAAGEMEKEPPWMPDEIRDSSAGGLDPLRKELEGAFASKREQMVTKMRDEFRLSRFEDIDQCLANNDLKGALRMLEESETDPAGDALFLKRRREELEMFGRVKDQALHALSGFQGLEVELRTDRGIVYKGDVQRVDRTAGTVFLEVRSGREVGIDVDDLELDNLLLWCEKSVLLDAGVKGLFAFYRSRLDKAEAFFKLSDDPEEVRYYLARINEIRNSSEMERMVEKREFELVLDRVEKFLGEGKWEEGFGLLQVLKEQHRSTAAWRETRHRRESLNKKLNGIRLQQEEKARIRELFSMHVDMLGEGRVHAKYGFDSNSELGLLKAHGRAWKIRDGELVCGLRNGEADQDFYHDVVGIRFGNQFDPGKPVDVSFTYTPPAEDDCPRFMGVSFFGGCLGIRSFADEKNGQVNHWVGELDGHGDYFYAPDLGEFKPLKGRPRSFSFVRGERYKITIKWTPGRELLFSVDGTDIYRTRAFVPSHGFIEIKTLRASVIDDIEVKGTVGNG